MAISIKSREELIKKYLEFFKSKAHKEIPGASLVPANDPTVLFTTAGMHPLVPYLLGEKHPLGKRLVNYQKCIRTGDIEEVGDDFHLTFFEMLGNWSLGDYFKKEAIAYTFEFITKELKIPIENLAVTVFEGDKNAAKDNESAEIWESLGIKKERIAFLPKTDNWWEHPSNNTPCGPCTEIFYWVGKGKPKGNPKTNKSEWAEIGNDVLMGFTKVSNENYIPAAQKNIDFGGGCERILTVLNKFSSVYETSIFQPIIKELERIANQKNLTQNRSARIIADHIKASIFIISDGVTPSNTERGYVLRRLIRNSIRHAYNLGIVENFTSKLVDSVINIYPDYLELKKNRNNIITELNKEENKFRVTLESGMREFEKISSDKTSLSGKEAFLLYQSYGFPIEMTQELAKEKKIKVNIEEFNEENKKHQELSRTASAGVFKSGLADNSETTKKLHTATHLLNEALRQVLKDKNIHQKGSNINPERLRFDFNFPRKLTEKEIKEIEDWVNDKIQKKLKVIKEEIPLKKALESGAQAEFGAKYPEIVSVYTITEGKNIFSKEICTGPHVSNTSELEVFKIQKEESSAAGIRRIKAVLL
jgi:alanyl-tRNA synthetase